MDFVLSVMLGFKMIKMVGFMVITITVLLAIVVDQRIKGIKAVLIKCLQGNNVDDLFGGGRTCTEYAVIDSFSDLVSIVAVG